MLFLTIIPRRWPAHGTQLGSNGKRWRKLGIYALEFECLEPRCCLSTLDVWLGGTGNYSNPANWSLGVVPNNGSLVSGLPATFTVAITSGQGGNSAVTLDMNATIDNLSIDAASSLTIADSESLTVAGSAGGDSATGMINNAGKIVLSGNASGTATLNISGTVTLTGGGSVTMTDSAWSQIQGTGPGAVLKNGASDLAQIRNIIASWGQTKASIFALAAQEQKPQDSLMYIVNESGLWDIVTAPGADPYHGAQYLHAQNALLTAYYDKYFPLNGQLAQALHQNDQAKYIYIQSEIYDLYKWQSEQQNLFNTYIGKSSDSTSLQTQYILATQDANTIQGAGQIGGLDQLVNLGTILANQSAPLTIEPSVTTLDNLGTLEASGGASLSLEGTVTNEETVQVDAGSSLIVGNYTQRSGLTYIDAGASFLTPATYNQAGGSTTIAAGGAFNAPAFVQAAGFTTVNGTLTASPVSIAGTLFGSGSVVGNVVSSGTLIPGDAPTPGALQITGDYTQQNAGALDIALSNAWPQPVSVDQLNVSGAATLETGSILNVSYVNGFVATNNEIFTFLNFASLAGSFTVLNGLTQGNVTFSVNDHPMYADLETPLIRPIVIADSAASITFTSATVFGDVNPMQGKTTVTFVYGTDPTLTTGTTTTEPQSLVNSNFYRTVYTPLTGLIPRTTYYYRVVATNIAGTTYGAIRSFSTLIPPTAATLWITDLTLTTVTFNALANPEGLATTVDFVYGTAPNLIGATRTTAISIGSGTSAVTVSVPHIQVQTYATYYYRVEAINPEGTSYGNIYSFIAVVYPTIAPQETTGITTTTATLNGLVNPEGTDTPVSFVYSTDRTFMTDKTTTAPQSIGNGTSTVAVHAALTGLQPGTTYYIFMQAGNLVNTGGYGITGSSVSTFTTVSTANVHTLDVGTADNAGSWTITGAGGSAIPAIAVGPAISLTSNGTRAGYIRPGENLASFNGLWYTDLPFDLPANATKVALAFSGLLGDDRVVLQLNGHNIGNAGIDPITGEPVTGAGRMHFPVGSETLFTFDGSTSGTITSWFNLGGSNDLRLVVNNTTGGITGTTSTFLNDNDFTDAALTATVTYTTRPPTSPSATTAAATSITETAATLNASINPQGGSTTGYFVYGTDLALSAGTTTAPQSIGSGTTSLVVTAALSGLKPGTTYYERVVARSAVGTTYGAILSFTTATPLPPPITQPPVTTRPPLATTSTAAAVSETEATLAACVDPQGSPTMVAFHYGTDPTLSAGTTTAPQTDRQRHHRSDGDHGAQRPDARHHLLRPRVGHQWQRDQFECDLQLHHRAPSRGRSAGRRRPEVWLSHAADHPGAHF